jgi:uncharacterized membrane protein
MPAALIPRMATMYSKMKIAGHPIHPMLVAFPITFYTTALVGYVVYGATSNAFWFQVGWLANVAGVVTAAVAAVPGFIDWAMGIPSRSKAKSVGLVHMLLNVCALGAFALNAIVNYDQWNALHPDSTLATALSMIGIASTLAAGFFGWTLVQTYHVGVDLTREQQNAEPPHVTGRLEHERRVAGT